MSETPQPTSHWWLKLHRPHSHSAHAPESYSSFRSRTGSASGSVPRAAPVRLDFTKNVSTVIPYPPFVNVEGVPNFRDLGGYPCVPSSTQPSEAVVNHSVRQGYVFRCSELSQITAVGTVYMVHDLQILTLFDLRSEREFANPRGQPQGVKCISTPVFRREDITPDFMAKQLYWGTAPDTPADAGFSQGYVDWYRQIAVYGAKSAYRTIFEHIRDAPGQPFVFHCSAGKDRTGVLSALILKLCGVDDRTVAWEYALTVPGMGVWEAAVEQEMVGDSMMPIRAHGGMTREEAHRMCGSRASNMARWLVVVLEGEFGGAAKYLETYCHFTVAEVDTIRKNLVIDKQGTVVPVEVPGMEDHPQT